MRRVRLLSLVLLSHRLPYMRLPEHPCNWESWRDRSTCSFSKSFCGSTAASAISTTRTCSANEITRAMGFDLEGLTNNPLTFVFSVQSMYILAQSPSPLAVRMARGLGFRTSGGTLLIRFPVETCGIAFSSGCSSSTTPFRGASGCP